MYEIIWGKAIHLKKYHFEFSKPENFKLFDECKAYICNADFNSLVHIFREFNSDEIALLVLASNKKMLEKIENTTSRRLWTEALSNSYQIAKNECITEDKIKKVFIKIKNGILESANDREENLLIRRVSEINKQDNLLDKIDVVKKGFPAAGSICWDRYNKNLVFYQDLFSNHQYKYVDIFTDAILVEYDYEKAIEIAAEYSKMGKGNCALFFTHLGINEKEEIYYPTYTIRYFEEEVHIYRYEQQLISYPEPFKYSGNEPENQIRMYKEIDGGFERVDKEHFLNHCKLFENRALKYYRFRGEQNE